MKKARLIIYLLGTSLYVVLWRLAVYWAGVLGWDASRRYADAYGAWGLYFLGLGWMVLIIERASHHYQARRRMQRVQARQEQKARPAAQPAAIAVRRRIWNPFDPDAWYYGRRGAKFVQSVVMLLLYSLLFVVLYLLVLDLLRGGRQEAYELPGGGGQQKAIPQVVKIQKVIRNKFVVNPFSAIKFEVPPIDDVKLQLNEITQHMYTIGYGKGEGAGFGGGTSKGKVRLIRLEYTGGDWDQDFGIGADLNMLIEYGIRTGHKVSDRTESRGIGELKNFVLGKSPPLVYMKGQKNITLSKYEVKVLRDYLLKQHGMLLGDNGGSRQWHNQFLAMMLQVLPEVRPVPVPLDDVIHRIPYRLPFLPYVAPHGGKEALGWWVDDRWVCYYHPGDMGDAWCDDHAGVKTEIWELCYQLGTNIIFYAHVEYNKWLDAQGKKQ